MATSLRPDCSQAPNKANTCLLLLCGLPGSGKTSLARALAREALINGVAVRVVSFDDLGCQPTVIAGGSDGSGAAPPFCPEAWQQARREALGALEAALTSCSSSSSNIERDAAQRQTWASLQQAAVSGGAIAAMGTGAPAPAAERGGAYTQQQQQPQSAGEYRATLNIHSVTVAQLQQQPQQQQEPPQQQQRQQQQYRLVIADDNMQYRSMRWKCCTLARTAGAAAVLLYLRCPETLAQQRNAERPPALRVPADVIARMAGRLEAPGEGNHNRSSGMLPGSSRLLPPGCSAVGHSSGSSGSTDQGQEQEQSSDGSEAGQSWEERCLVTWHSSQAMTSAGTAALWQQVWQRWGPPLPPPTDPQAEAAVRAGARAATAASALHAVDLATRQVLSDCMQLLAGAGQQCKVAAAQRLNAARRQLMQAAGGAADAAADSTASDRDSAALAAAAAEQWAEKFRQICEQIICDALES